MQGPVTDLYYIKSQLRSPDFFLIGLANIVDEMVDGIILYNAYRTAAEACACHTGANAAVDLPSFLYQSI